MKKLFINSCALFITMAILQNSVWGQAYMNYSRYTSGVNDDNATKMQVVNGETFIVGYTTSPDFPVTNGSTYQGYYDITVTKYSSNGTILYSSYIGGNSYDECTSMKVINGEVYILGRTNSTNYPVTNGSVAKGFIDIVVTKLFTNGSIAFSTYLGGNRDDYPDAFEIAGDKMFITGQTESTNFPQNSGFGFNGFITKISTIDGAIILSKVFGDENGGWIEKMHLQNGSVYLVGNTDSDNLPVTIGNYPIGVQYSTNIYVQKLNSSNFNTVFCRYISGNNYEQVHGSEVINGELHLTGRTRSTNFPVTNGSTHSPELYDDDAFYTKLNVDGSIGFSTYLATNNNDILFEIVISNGEIYLAGQSYTTSNFSETDILIYKINTNGTIAYTKKLRKVWDNDFPTFTVLNGSLYIAGTGATPAYPVTNSSQHYGYPTGFFTQLGPSGDILYSTFLGKMNDMLPMQIVNNKIYLLGISDIASYPVTNGSTITGKDDNILIVLKPDGTNIFSGYIGGSNEEQPVDMAIENNDIYIAGNTSSANFPVTDNILYQGAQDQFFTKLSFCSSKYKITSDTLSPKIQTVCKYGLAQNINGTELIVPADSLPIIYRNGIPNQQYPIGGVIYQWQIAYAISGPWTEIQGATYRDYRPVVGTVNQYYRRLSFSPADCGTALIHISDTASALVNNLTAPTVNGGGPFHTCPGSVIIIGGSPTVSGGNLPYASYVWDMGAAAVENPSVSPIVNTIYTLIVTDAMGCQQIGQAVVLAHHADAGPDKGSCAGTFIKIGTSAIADLPGIVYDWQPSTGLTNNNIAQPFANPVIPTEYELILTVPKSGGGICLTKDTVKVIPVAAPITPNMAGPDKVICLADSISLGTIAETGFTYSWSPANYLINNITSTVTYYPGSIDMPIPNPATVTLTAQKDGCSFTDQTVVATIESRAGFSICGPGIIGLPDRTPNINETYSWVRNSGPGNFTGATNLPQVPISASVGGTTVYGLTVSYNGESCYSEVTVPESCNGIGNSCEVQISVDAKYHCPGYAVNNGDVTLHASSNITNAIYTWSPQAGLSAYTGNAVHLTDNVPRLYTVTVTDANDPTIQCTEDVLVNDLVFAAPVFPAPDTATCANTPVSIGLPTVTGYTYEWTGNGLSSYSISNPIATVASQTLYTVKVTNNTGCELNDTVMVSVQNVLVNAGPDWLVCSNGIARLGSAAQSNTTYLWEPQAAPWQNGTNQFSAQPEVLVATNLMFTVTATTSAGCISTDLVNIIVNNSPTIPNAPDKVICKGRSVQIGSPALPGVTYQWTPNTGLNNATSAQPLATPAVTTTYTVLATFPGSCVLPATDQVIVTVSDPSFDLPDINYCPSNGPVALGVGAPAGMNEYYWLPSQMVTNYLTANPSTLNPPPSVPTTFTLRVRNTNGCYYTDTIQIIPTIESPIAGIDKIICKGQTASIGSVANITGPAISYNWSPVTNLNNPSSPNPVFTATNSGVFTYILTKTDNAVSCTSKDTIVITVTELVFTQLSTSTVCQNSCVQIGTSPVAGIQYQWTPASGLSNTNIANPLACVGAVSASYMLVATDPNGCTATANIVVGVNSLPAPQITIPTVTACLGDNNAAFNPIVSPPGSYLYLWSPDNGTLSNIYSANPGIITTGTGNTQYSFQVTNDITGCTNTATGNLLVNTCPTLATTGNFMWFDNNENGLQDPGESGVSGMNIKLYNNIGFVVSSTVTDVNGVYYFGDVPPGNDYYVIFNKPAGYTFTIQHVGGIGANNNSKADLSGRSNNFNIAAGENINNIDAGIKTGPIPVSLLSFTAVLRNTEVSLNWKTTSEYNNQYFNVERSNDGINFIVIGSVTGNGTTSLPHSYSLLDRNPAKGINYYRLKQVDLDGKYTYSNIVPVQINNIEIVSSYYNNLNNSIQVIFNKKQDNVHIMLYGANGQLLSTANATNNIASYKLDLPLLASGVYMLRVISDQLSYTKKLFISSR